MRAEPGTRRCYVAQSSIVAAPLGVSAKDILLVLEARPTPVDPRCWFGLQQPLVPQNTGHLPQQQYDFRHRRCRASHDAVQDPCRRLTARSLLEEVRRISYRSAQALARGCDRTDVACLPGTASRRLSG